MSSFPPPAPPPIRAEAPPPSSPPSVLILFNPTSSTGSTAPLSPPPPARPLNYSLYATTIASGRTFATPPGPPPPTPASATPSPPSPPPTVLSLLRRLPALRHHQASRQTRQQRLPDTVELISAVDIYYEDKLISSKVLVTETLSAWFLNTPFRLELLDPKETVPTPLKSDDGTLMARTEERLRVSWILIDPVKRRAVNPSRGGGGPSALLTDDIQVRYATVVGTAAGAGAVRGGGNLRGGGRRRGSAAERGKHVCRGDGREDCGWNGECGNFGGGDGGAAAAK
ncbi:UNVERIFIED_CONTAM: F-box protein [Sesamum latifolium]|uniref:F-box protein n=1 Tax=Sesamum latifolium TaxID=2727402 RepID=A0AAW2Y310_9LAMI